MSNKRFMIDDAGSLIDIETHTCYDYVDELVDVLNRLNDENDELKKENNKLHTRIFEMRSQRALERTEISNEYFDGKKALKEFLEELEKW